ncbi:MAG: hypothetical protein IAE99_02695 [Rhodothermales bacterium]|nr:hypothetical protein [Rhodothermales bacterium]
MTLCVFEDAAAPHLAPLASTRPVFDLRLAARTLLDTIRDAIPHDALALVVRPSLAGVTAEAHPDARLGAPETAALWVSGRFVAHDGPALNAIRRLAADALPRALVHDGKIVAAFALPGATVEMLAALPTETVESAHLIGRLWDFNAVLRDALAADLPRFVANASGHPGLHPSAIVANPAQVHLGTSARVFPGAILNAEAGWIVLDEGAEVHEGAVVRGPVYVGKGSQVKPLGFVEGSAIGPGCKIGGEMHSTVFLANSNKGHSGFVGNAYVGAWCNFGAGTDTSNLRNDYREVEMFDREDGAYAPTGQQFIGLIFGDHSKCSIGTTFNTGTVVGVGCNLYGAGFHDRHIPDFSWGEPGAYVPYRFDKFIRVAEAVYQRRGRSMSDAERTLLKHLAEHRLAYP